MPLNLDEGQYLVGVNEAEMLCDVPRATLTRWLRSGRTNIKAQKIGGTWMIDRRTLPKPSTSRSRQRRRCFPYPTSPEAPNEVTPDQR